MVPILWQDTLGNGEEMLACDGVEIGFEFFVGGAVSLCSGCVPSCAYSPRFFSACVPVRGACGRICGFFGGDVSLFVDLVLMKSSSSQGWMSKEVTALPLHGLGRTGGSLEFLRGLRFSRFQFGLAMSGSFSRICSGLKLRGIDEVAPALMAI